MNSTKIPLSVLRSDLDFCKHRVRHADIALQYGCETRSDGESWRTIRADAEGVILKIRAELGRREAEEAT